MSLSRAENKPLIFSPLLAWPARGILNQGAGMDKVAWPGTEVGDLPTPVETGRLHPRRFEMRHCSRKHAHKTWKDAPSPFRYNEQSNPCRITVVPRRLDGGQHQRDHRFKNFLFPGAERGIKVAQVRRQTLFQGRSKWTEFVDLGLSLSRREVIVGAGAAGRMNISCMCWACSQMQLRTLEWWGADTSVSSMVKNVPPQRD